MENVVVKHVEHGAYTRAMASGLTIAGPSPDGFIHIQFWREGLRMTEEHFGEEVFQQNGIEVAKWVPAGNATEAFREDVATIMVPVPKFTEFCDAMCKMRDQIPKAIAAREAAMAQNGDI